MKWCVVSLSVILFAVAAPTTLAMPPNNTLATNGDVLLCSGRPWIDVMCYGADPTDTSDSTLAFNNAISAAIAGGFPVHVPAGKFKVTSTITVDTSGLSVSGFRLISENATLDGTAVASGSVLVLQRSGGTVGSPAVDQNLVVEGDLTVLGNGAGYVVQVGKSDFSDEFKGIRASHLVASNASTAAGAGGVKVNFVVGGSLWIGATTSGGSASTAAVALEQVQDSTLSGTGQASGASASSLLVENGASTGDTVVGFNYGVVSSTCLSITSSTATFNTFVAPSFGCATGVNASGSGAGNVLVPPTFAGANRGAISGGVTIVGRGALNRYATPAVSSYTALCSDDGTMVSSANGTGPAAGWASVSLPVTLPNPATCGVGWSTGYVTDGNKALVLTASSGSILAGGQALSTITLWPGNYEFVVIRSDGTNMRVEESSIGTMTHNGASAPTMPSRWVFPGGPGYATSEADNTNVVSSSSTSSGLAVTLPSTNTIVAGWTIGVVADKKPLSIATNSSSGGNIIEPVAGAAITTYSLPQTYNVATVQFDGTNFRVLMVLPPPQTPAQVPDFPNNWTTAPTSYTVLLSDNGKVFDTSNSGGTVTLTLPPVTSLPVGWTVGLVSHNNVATIQVNGVNGGTIMEPYGGLAVSAYKSGQNGSAFFQFDGSNFRVVSVEGNSGGSTVSRSIVSNANLQTSIGTAGTIYRLGFAAAGDGGAVLYNWSSSPCSLAGGLGDNGSQVQGLNGGCWLADFPASGAPVAAWGTGSSALQAAVNWSASVGGGTIVLPRGPMTISTPIDAHNLATQLTIRGAGCVKPAFGLAFVQPASGSVLIGNTGHGNAVIDAVGSNNVKFEDFCISTIGAANPSTTGVLFGASTGSQAGSPGGSGISLIDFGVQLTASSNPSSVPIYYNGGGLSGFYNIWTTGDYGLVLSSDNPLAIAPPYSLFGTPIGTDGVFVTGAFLGTGKQPVLYIELSNNIDVAQTYLNTINGGPGFVGTPYPLLLTNVIDARIKVEEDYFPSLFEATGTIDHVHISGTVFRGTTPIASTYPLVGIFDGSGTKVFDSSFDVQDASAGAPFSNYFYTMNGFTPTVSIFSDNEFSFSTFASQNVLFANLVPNSQYFNIRFNGTADATNSLQINGVAAPASSIRAFMNGLRIGTL